MMEWYGWAILGYLVISFLVFIVSQKQEMTWQGHRFDTYQRSHEETQGHIFMAIFWPILFVMVVFALLGEL